MLRYVIYLSSSTHLYSDTDLEDILTVSRRNNQATGVTGLLLYHEGTILQLLEGEQSAVDLTYKRILVDRRHTGILKMAEADAPERCFTDWTMGFRKLSDKDWSLFADAVHLDPVTSDRLRTPVKNFEMRTLMTSFISLNFERNRRRA